LRSKIVDVQTRSEESARAEARTKGQGRKEKEEVTGVSRVAEPGLSVERAELIAHTKGFIPTDEGEALFQVGCLVSVPGPYLEVGAYCGRSAVYLGAAAEQRGTVLYSLDHHHGSEENQLGWEHHDAEVVDSRTGRMDTLPFFRRTIEAAKLEETVIAVVGHSVPVATHWQTPIALLFIDGGHGVAHARADFKHWVPKIASGGLLAIHDVFPNPADGGRPPYEDIYLPAIASGHFVEEDSLRCGSLRVLKRT
jgi:MMP 1-O-methyltransferase